MFGERTLGRPLSRQSQPGSLGTRQSTENIGQISGAERFLRGNRNKRDFVGSDTRDRTNFVGEQSGTTRGAVVSSVQDLRAQREVNMNQALRKPNPRQMYYPRLRVNFDYAQPTGVHVSERAQYQLQRTETLNLRSPIAVSVEDGTATLRGTVASAHDREMAELMMRFEPGISSVKNELEVQSPSPQTPPEPSSRN